MRLTLDAQITFIENMAKAAAAKKNLGLQSYFEAVLETLKMTEKGRLTTPKSPDDRKPTKPIDTTIIEDKPKQKKAKHEEWTDFKRIHRQICDSRKVLQNIDGTQGAALNKIIDQLKAYANGDGKIATAAWQYIADGWDTLPTFYKQNVDCTKINQNLSVIKQHFTNDTDSKNKSGGNHKRGGVTLDDLSAMFE